MPGFLDIIGSGVASGIGGGIGGLFQSAILRSKNNYPAPIPQGYGFMFSNPSDANKRDDEQARQNGVKEEISDAVLIQELLSNPGNRENRARLKDRGYDDLLAAFPEPNVLSDVKKKLDRTYDYLHVLPDLYQNSNSYGFDYPFNDGAPWYAPNVGTNRIEW